MEKPKTIQQKMGRMGLLFLLVLTGCAKEQEPVEQAIQETMQETEQEIEQEAVQETAPETSKVSQEEPVSELQDKNVKGENRGQAFLGKYESFDDWRGRHMGSVGQITDRTILVSVYLNEPKDTWTEEEMQETQRLMRIGYDYLVEQMDQVYGTKMELLYDVQTYPDLLYTLSIEQPIPDYVTTEMERVIDDWEDQWIAKLPVQTLMEKYQADSIGFLFFVPHEGCSYSSMHFIDDGIATWDESCLLYLQDMYSETLAYETPAVYAHELLHLYGAEDLYKEAEVFSKETYALVKEKYPEDIMYKTYDVISGVYTTYPNEVKQEITPLTAYLVGVPGVSYPLQETEELLKEEIGCFSGSTYDRPF